MSHCTYSVDTSALIHAWIRAYPPRAFPSFWRNLEALMADGRLIASEEVLRELEKKADDLHAWAREHEAIFARTDVDIQHAVSEILARPGLSLLVDSHKNRSWSDPFVIAVAKVKGCVVVSQEFPTNNPSNPKIPDACRHLGIRCIFLLDLILEEGWVM